MAAKKAPVSQSRTMWVKKGTVVNGKTVKKGYVAQYGKPEKKVTNRVKLEVATPKRGKAGDVVKLKAGRYATKGKGAGGGTAGPSKTKTPAPAAPPAGARPAARTALSAAERRAMAARTRKGTWGSARAAATSTPSAKPTSTKPTAAKPPVSYGPSGPGQTTMSAPKTPQENERRTIIRNGVQVKQKYVQGEWRDTDASGRVRIGPFNW